VKFKVLLCGALLLVLSLISSASDISRDVAPIGFYDTTPKRIDRNVLYSIFTLKITSWSDGTHIKVFILPRDSDTSREFIYEYFNVMPNHYYDMINASSSSGKTNSAFVIESEVDLVRKVAATSGAVGFANRSIIINVGESSVKIINVY
jgi:ABC-type phosphate transport system substrate-binding protein